MSPPAWQRAERIDQTPRITFSLRRSARRWMAQRAIPTTNDNRSVS
jgi:hypothetical protein